MKGSRAQNKKVAKVTSGGGSSVASTSKAQKVGRARGKAPEVTAERECVLETKERISPSNTANGIQDRPVPRPHTKIKLQLYPIDERTCIELEKDGKNPYLELTLRPTKRISSVLKHINNKWGTSKVALGEPMLLPYNTHVDTSCRRTWTMRDIDVIAGDVYASIGTPATFRLRYGWVPPPELMTRDEPSPSIPYDACLQSNDAQKDCSSDAKDLDKNEVQQTGETSGSFKFINDDGQSLASQLAQSASVWNNDLSNISIGSLLSSEASLLALLNADEPRSMENDRDRQASQNSHAKAFVPAWADSLTNISIGGLLSEASLQGKINNGKNTKSTASNPDSQQPTQIFTDSLDAFIYSRTRCPQGLRPPTHDSQTFILDGEETCHAFPVQKFSSSRKRVSAVNGSSGCFSTDSGSKSLKFPKIEEINTQTGVSEDQACQDTPTDLIFSPRTYNDENSLGLANIKWGESLGPFDLGLSAFRKLTKDENTSSSRLSNKYIL